MFTFLWVIKGLACPPCKSIQEMEGPDLLWFFLGILLTLALKLLDTKMDFVLVRTVFIYWAIKNIGLLVVTISEKSHVKFNVS